MRPWAHPAPGMRGADTRPVPTGPATSSGERSQDVGGLHGRQHGAVPEHLRLKKGQGVIKVQTQLQLSTFNTFTTFKDPGTWAPRCQSGRPNTRLKTLDEANPARESRNWDRISTTYKSLPGNHQHEIIHRKSCFLNF